MFLERNGPIGIYIITSNNIEWWWQRSWRRWLTMQYGTSHLWPTLV